MLTRAQKLKGSLRIALSAVLFGSIGAILLPSAQEFGPEPTPQSLVPGWSDIPHYDNCIDICPSYKIQTTYTNPPECTKCHLPVKAFADLALEMPDAECTKDAKD